MSLTKRYVLSTALIVLGCVLWGLARPSPVSALSELPDNSDLVAVPRQNGHGPEDVYLDAAYQGGGILLHSPTIKLRLYFDNPTGFVTILNGSGNCYGGGISNPVDSSTNAVTNFIFIDAGNRVVRQIPSTDPAFATGGNGCNDTGVRIPLTNLTPATIPGTTQIKYYVDMYGTNGTPGSINAFRVRIDDDGVVSYSNTSGAKFAMEDRQNQGDWYTTTYKLPFAPDCTVSGTTTTTLRWYDDDYGTSYQGTFTVRLIEYDSNGAPTGRVDTYNGPWTGEGGLGSGDAEGTWQVSVTQGRKYVWEWAGISELNGVQFQLPYDSFYFDYNCGGNRIAIFNATCTHLGFRVQNQANDRYDVRLLVDGVNDVLLDNNGAGYLPNQNITFNNEDVPFNRFRDFGEHSIQIRVRNRTGNVTPMTSRARVIGPCATASCVGGPSVVGGDSPTPGDTVRIRQRISTNIGYNGNPILYTARLTAAGASNITAAGAGPPGTAGTWTADASQAIVSGIGYPANPTWGGPNEDIEWDVTWPIAGNYDTSVAITGPLSLTCSSTGSNAISVTLKPYLRVWGGDVLVGCSGSTVWGTTAGDPGRGKILAFSRSNGTLNRGSGSGSTLLVQALQGIEGFSSSQRSTGGMPSDKYLTLANSGSGVSPTWGGNYGSSQCASDFYAAASASPGTFSGMPTASGSYTYSGPVSLPGATIQAGRDITIYVDGDVTITGNITYAGASTGWSSLSDIPEFKLIAKGDIKVSRTVSELNGTYIAQPRDATSGGTIYTCTDGTTVLSAPATLISRCSSQLTVYGSFIAKSVKFLRLSGSLNSSVSPTDTAAASTAAEKFVYGPEAWLKSPATSVSAGTYDSITSLPPAF